MQNPLIRQRVTPYLHQLINFIDPKSLESGTKNENELKDVDSSTADKSNNNGNNNMAGKPPPQQQQKQQQQQVPAQLQVPFRNPDTYNEYCTNFSFFADGLLLYKSLFAPDARIKYVSYVEGMKDQSMQVVKHAVANLQQRVRVEGNHKQIIHDLREMRRVLSNYLIHAHLAATQYSGFCFRWF